MTPRLLEDVILGALGVLGGESFSRPKLGVECLCGSHQTCSE